MPVPRDRLPILVGEDNPYGGDPYFALYPAPDGCAGHRLCRKVLGMSRAQYLDQFERVNLCSIRWATVAARVRATELMATGRKLILLGAKVCGAFGVPFEPFVEREGKLLVLPHPSGRCRAWSETGAYRRARAAVAAFLPYLSPMLGVDDE